MNFPFYIAKRYLRSKNSTNAINIITSIAMFGVIVGTIALFVILSVFSGLRTFSYSLLNDSDPDIKISATKSKSFEYSKQLDEILISDIHIASFSKVVEERVFLKYGDKSHIAYVKGVDVNYNEVVQVDSSLWSGTWIDPEFQNTAVIGYGIYAKLSLHNNVRPLQVFVPKPGKGLLNPNNAFRSTNTQVVGIYNGSEDFRNKYVFTEIEVAQELLGLANDRVTSIELKVRDEETIDEQAKQLQEALGSTYKVQTRVQLNQLIYKVINTENFVSYLIATLIVIIALFNIIGSIIMMILDKRKNLKTLSNVGATVKEIKQIFTFQGLLLCLVGMLIGLLIAVILVLLQYYMGWIKIAVGIPYPVEFKWFNLGIVALTICVLGFAASKIASSRITRKFIEAS
ncbi:ABC transporter permease [Tenacibaculum agarivorans]|uniref:ABC transporter permease n=1 Tax=Tenacibaculum agarivorans TaxID=1908389 RepID=UPI00094B875E|nr:ABC transporter permease [Tenacibaculum agarivorans]